MDELHEGHPGIVRSKQLACSYVRRPSIEADLEHRVKACADQTGSLVLLWGSPALSFTVRATTPRDSSTWCRPKDQLLARTTDPDREASDQEGYWFLAFPQSVDPGTSSAPTISGSAASQDIQTAGARRYPTRDRRPPDRYQAGV
ncbi:uncharacterized protein LOC144102609 [Amblyomma americanum]